MSLQKYLRHRKFYETLAIACALLLFGVTNTTSKVIEDLLSGLEPDWPGALATEFTAVATLIFIFPILFAFLRRLSLGLGNLRWRVLWLVPGFFVFSLLHVGSFTLARVMLWSAAGEHYVIERVFLNLVYEMRKDLLAYLGVLAAYYSYRFILDRLQGEAKFLEQEGNRSEGERFREQFLVKMLNREFLVRVNEILWVQSASNYVLLRCGERHYPMRQTLKKLTEQLDPSRFQRVHRTAIVNLDAIDSINEKSDSTLELKTGESVPVSKTYLPALRAALAAGRSTLVG